MVRPLFALALVLVLFAGCLGRDGPAASAPPASGGAPEGGPPDGGAGGAGEPSASGADFEVEAPDLPLGRAWSYRADGVYNSERDFTVVVASKTASGYLFAAADERGLAETAVWGRDVLGPRDRSLNPEGSKLLDFPLRDGKSWDLWGRKVTARAAEVETPAGPEPGFVIEGARDESVIRYAYAPSVGFLTRFESLRGDVAYQRLVLDAVGESRAYVWMETGAPVEASPDAPTATLTVPSGFDVVVAGGGGTAGARGALLAPPTAPAAPWTFAVDGTEAWSTAVLPAAEGPWGVAVVPPPDGFAALRAVAVKWIRGEV